MMRGLRLSLIAACLPLSPAIAQTLSSQQSNAVNHLAQVMAIELECPEHEANSLNVAVLTSGYKLDINREPVLSRMTRLVGEHQSGIRSSGSKIGCLVGRGLYGPGVQNVANLLRKK